MLYKLHSLCIFAVTYFFVLWSNLFSSVSFFFSPLNKLSSFTQNVNTKLFLNRINMDFSKKKLCGVTIKWSSPSQPKFTVQHQDCKQFGSCFFSTAQETFKANISEVTLLGWSSTIWDFLCLILKQDSEYFPLLPWLSSHSAAAD